MGMRQNCSLSLKKYPPPHSLFFLSLLPSFFRWHMCVEEGLGRAAVTFQPSAQSLVCHFRTCFS
jgi:hypothetical protein